MISPTSCKINALYNIEKYCTKEIEPLLLKANGQPIYFGKYNFDGTKIGIVMSTYAKERPHVEYINGVEINPLNIKKYLENLGYKVDWVRVEEPYHAGYSSSRKTKYYSSGYVSYYSLKIAC